MPATTFTAHRITRFSKNRNFLSLFVLMVFFLSSLLLPIQPMTASASGVPTPLSPAENTLVTATGYVDSAHPHYLAAPPFAIPIFSWSPVEGAKAYRIQLANNIGFSPIAMEVTTSNTSFAPTKASQLPDGPLYWRVRVESPAAGNYSSPMMFEKMWASPDNAPTLISPLAGQVIDFLDAPMPGNPQYRGFVWEAVPGAGGYRFQIAQSENGFNNPLYWTDTAATSHQPKDKLENGEYFWRVIPMYGEYSDRLGTPSEARSFTLAYGKNDGNPSTPGEAQIPRLIAPANNSEPTFTPQFQWEAVKGAERYELQYTSAPSCNFGVAGTTVTVNTSNSSYTPTTALPNDKEYCWHVRAWSGKSVSDWSPTWKFLKKWYIQPIPLTPTDNFQQVKNPFFSWTPVPGAKYYKIEVCEEVSFPCKADGFEKYAVNPFYVMPDFSWSKSESGIWYWRVTPYDGSNNQGNPSNAALPNPQPRSFRQSYFSVVPELVYPLFYYPPDDYVPPFDSVSTNPHEDRTVPLPAFMWHKVVDVAGYEPQAYLIQVDEDPNFGFFTGNPVKWEFKTENLVASPSRLGHFKPEDGKIYYWRVCTLTDLSDSGCALTEWSQIWKTRFDSSLLPPATDQLTLLRPVNAHESIETTPLFEWMPLKNASRYLISISQDPSFNTVVDSATVDLPLYAMQQSLAKRNANRLNYGTYYWKVCNADNPQQCSPVWRFQVASQSQWRYERVEGDVNNRLQVGSDPDDVADDNYELTNLTVSQDRNYWFVGFSATLSSDPMAYWIYIDIDHIDNSGASSVPDGPKLNVSTIAAHRPEYAIYIPQRNGSLDPGSVLVYRSSGTGWGNFTLLTLNGGDLTYYAIDNHVEVIIPRTAIGLDEFNGSMAIALFSVNEATGTVMDSVPTSTNLTTLDRFASVSERMNILTPPSNAGGDPTTYPSILPFFYDYPYETPWEGFSLEVAVDEQFNTVPERYTLFANAPHFATSVYTEFDKVHDIQGDNTYYWRVRPQYYHTNYDLGGAWSQSNRFERKGFIPQNLHTSVSFATPTFSWDMVEGAMSYDIQVDNDPNFGSPEINITTTQNQYTHTDTLRNGLYYWHVRVRRDGIEASDKNWSPVQEFRLTLPTVQNLTPNISDVKQAVGYAPTLCWDPVIISDGGLPVFAAWKYHVEIFRDASLSPRYDSVITEQTCWTPTKGYEDGTYYWRVTLVDGRNKEGASSPIAKFTKQYPQPVLKAPSNGTQFSGTPIFKWEPVAGAAQYRIEIALNENFSPTFDAANISNAHYVPTKEIPTGSTVYWRVAMIDRNGRQGPFNDAVSIYRPGLPNGKRVYLPFLGGKK